MQNIRWKVITILVVLLVFSGVGVYPILASVKAGSWIRAWTAGTPDSSSVHIGPLE